MKNLIRIVVLGILFCSCGDNDNPLVQDIDPEFNPYVLEFFEEGAKRGLEYSLEEYTFTVQFDDLSEDNYWGYCTFDSNEILIDSMGWMYLDEYYRRFIIFHELGHCILERRHRNGVFENGECRSIMRGAERDFSCYLNLYSDLWWQYYVDELFNKDTEFPNWYSLNNDYSSFVDEELIFELDTLASSLKLQLPNLSTVGDFKLDIWHMGLNQVSSSIHLLIDNLAYQFCSACAGENTYVAAVDVGLLFNGLIEFEFFYTHDKLSLVKKNGQLTYFVNEVFVNTFETDLWNGAGEMDIGTSEPMDILLTISKIK